MPDVTPKTEYVANVLGRDIGVKQPSETQLVLLGRDSKRAKQAAVAEDYEGGMRAMIGIMNVIENLIVSEDDQDYVASKMADGSIEAPDLLDAIFEAVKRLVEGQPTAPQKKVAVKKVTGATSARTGRGRAN